MKVGIIGYGYVGKAMRALMAPAFEIGVYDVASHVDVSALRGSELILICVPTPSRADGSCDTSIVEEAADIASEQAPDALVCIKSAVSPGFTDLLNVMYDSDRFHVSPEYLGEGTRFVPPWAFPDPTDARSHDFVIVGGPRASEVLDFFQAVMATTARYIGCTAKEAELTKRMENAFFALKVSFCNEMACIAEGFGIDYKALRELWLLDSRVGRSHTAVLRDAPGFGGKCLPKDLLALVSEAENVGYDATLLRSVLSANKRFKKADV